jgi:Uma2 family endonuclease
MKFVHVTQEALMAGVVSFEEQVEIPLDIRSLEDFRRWALSDEFPQRGRIDYVGGRIEVDMSPENLFFHGTLKMEIAAVLHQLVAKTRIGHVVTDRTRISCPPNLSVEPDVVVLMNETLADRRARLVRAKRHRGYVEVEGPADLIVECVSDSSVEKDTRRLPQLYFDAGVREFWLTDARGDNLLFRIYHRGDKGFVPQVPDQDGYQPSAVLQRRFLLNCLPGDDDTWQYDLLHRPL